MKFGSRNDLINSMALLGPNRAEAKAAIEAGQLTNLPTWPNIEDAPAADLALVKTALGGAARLDLFVRAALAVLDAERIRTKP